MCDKPKFIKDVQKAADKGIKDLQKAGDQILSQATGGQLGTPASQAAASGKSMPNMPEIQNITPNWDQLQPNLNQDLMQLNPEKLQSAAVNLGTDIQREAVNMGTAAQTAATDAGSALQAATTEALSKVPTPAAQVAAAVTNAGFVPTPAGVAAGLAVQAGAVPTPAGVALKAAQDVTGYTVATPAGIFAEEAIDRGAFPTPAGILAEELGTVPTPAGMIAKAVKEETGYYTPAQWMLDQALDLFTPTKGDGGSSGGEATALQDLPELPTTDDAVFPEIEQATTKSDQMTEEERLRRIRRLMLNRYGREDTVLTGTADTTGRRRTAPGFMGM